MEKWTNEMEEKIIIEIKIEIASDKSTNVEAATAEAQEIVVQMMQMESKAMKKNRKLIS